MPSRLPEKQMTLFRAGGCGGAHVGLVDCDEGVVVFEAVEGFFDAADLRRRRRFFRSGS